MPNPKDLRSDNLLQRYQIGFRQARMGFTAARVFPIFNTQGLTKGRYKTYERADAFQTIDTHMAGKQEAPEVEWDVSESSFLTQPKGAKHGWTGRDENEAVGGPVRLPRKAATIVADTMLLDWQRAVDAKITTGNISQNTTLSGSAQWNNATSNPYSDIVTGLKTIEKAIGALPGFSGEIRAVCGGGVWWEGLQNNPEIVERVKASQVMPGVQNITPQLVAQTLGLAELNVASAIYNTAAEGQTVSTDYSLGNKFLIYAAQESPDEDTPHFGTTFVSKDFTTTRYRMPERGPGGTTYVQTEMERDVQIVSSVCAYLIDTPVDATVI